MTQTPQISAEQVEALIKFLWQEMCELPDRTSPEGYPGMAMATLKELTAIVETWAERAAASTPASRGKAADALVLLQERAHYAEGTAQANIDRAEAAEAKVERLTEAGVALDLIREEAAKSNAPLGRSDSLAMDRIRAILNIKVSP